MRKTTLYSILLLFVAQGICAQTSINFLVPQLNAGKESLIRHNPIADYAVLYTCPGTGPNCLTVLNFNNGHQPNYTIELKPGMTVTDIAFAGKDTIFLIGSSEKDKCGYVGYCRYHQLMQGQCTIRYELLYPIYLAAPETGAPDTLQCFDNLHSLRPVLLNGQRHLLFLGERANTLIAHDPIPKTLTPQSCYIDYKMNSSQAEYITSDGDYYASRFDDIVVTQDYIVALQRWRDNGNYIPAMRIFPQGCYNLSSHDMIDSIFLTLYYTDEIMPSGMFGDKVGGNTFAVDWDNGLYSMYYDHYFSQVSILSSNPNTLSFSISNPINHTASMDDNRSPSIGFFCNADRYTLLRGPREAAYPEDDDPFAQIYEYDISNPSQPIGRVFSHSGVTQQSLSKYRQQPSFLVSGQTRGIATVSHETTQGQIDEVKRCMGTVAVPISVYIPIWGDRKRCYPAEHNTHDTESLTFVPAYRETARETTCQHQ